MSMPNRFALIERRLDIIESRLGIKNSVTELNRVVGCYKCKDFVAHEDSEICECGHHTNDHSYSYPSALDNNLYCDKCDCKNFVPHAISEPEVKDGS